MKITRQNLTKLLAVVVAVVMLAVNTVVSFATNSGSTEPPIIIPTTQLGYYMGESNTAYPGSNIDIRPNGSKVSGDNLAAVQPTLTAQGEGYDGTYAMKIGVEGKPFSRYLMKWRIDDSFRSSTIKANTSYTIEMKVKPVSGSISGIYAGHYYTNESTEFPDFKSSTSYDSNDLAAGEWTTVTFTYTHSYAARWVFLNMTSNDANGGVVLVDDIKIYATSDTSKTNVFLGGRIDVNKSTGSYVLFDGGINNIGSFEDVIVKTPTVDFDNSVDSDYIYAPIGEIKYYTKSGSPTISTSMVPTISAAGEGVKGSYALELNTTAAGNERLFFAPTSYKTSGKGFMKSSTYTVNFKVRVKTGTVKYLDIGVYENNVGYISGLYLYGIELTSEWQSYTFQIDTSSAEQWRRLTFYYATGDGGAVLQLDDIEVLEHGADNSLNPIEFNGNGTIGSYDTKIKKSASLPFDNTVDPNVEYAPGVVKYYTHATNTSISTSMVPTISAAGEGVKGSYAMELNTTAAGSERLYLQPTSYTQFGKAILPDSTYTVKFKVRVKSGTVESFEGGVFENGGTGFISGMYLYGLELSDEWQCYSFDVSTTSITGQWRKLAFHYTTGDGGAVVQLDDIEVYDKAADSTLTPIEFNGNGTIGSYDSVVKSSLPFDNTPYEDTSNLISPEKFGVRTSDVAPYISEKGDGVKGTYAMNIPVNSSFENTITLQGPSRTDEMTSLHWDTTYTVDFKIRVKTGAVAEFKVGVANNSITSDTEIEGVTGGTLITDETDKNYGKWSYPSSEVYAYTLSGIDVTSQWKRFTCQFTTDKNNKNWKKIALSLVGTTADTVVQIDDLQVYWMNGEERVDIFSQSGATGYIDIGGTFDEWRAPYTTAAVDNTPDGSAYYPIYFEDWTDTFTVGADDKKTYTNKISGTVPTIFNDGLASDVIRETSRNTIIPRLEKDSGVKGSYAFVIGDTSVPNVSAYETGLRYGATTQLKDNTEYTFKVKLKKEGTVDRFKIGVRESYAAGTIHYALQLLDSEISNEWVEYTFNYTTDGNCESNWSEIFFAYTSAAGAKIYIDEVYMYVSSDEEKQQRFPWYDFDYTDLGQVEPVTFEEWPDTLKMPYFDPSTNSDKTVVKADPENGIEGFSGTGNIAQIKCYDGDGVLAIGFNDKASKVEFRENLSASKPGGTYKISFKILVQGDNVEYCRVGLYNSFQKYEYYNGGASFNQYEQGKWTDVSFTWTDPANFVTGKGYRYFVLDFSGGAGSGVLLDDLKITYVSDDWGGDAPNISDFGDFGTPIVEKPDLVWSDEFTYKKEEK